MYRISIITTTTLLLLIYIVENTSSSSSLLSSSSSSLIPPLPSSCSTIDTIIEKCQTYTNDVDPFWTYRWCMGSSLYQVPSKAASGASSSLIGRYDPSSSTGTNRIYQNGTYCAESKSRRRGEVRYRCCPEKQEASLPVFISGVHEPTPCYYVFDICMSCLCEGRSSSGEINETTISKAQVSSLKDSATSLFYHSYRAYMRHGFPNDEIKPLTCRPIRQPQTAGTMLTLIDSLDTLALLDDKISFGEAIQAVSGRLSFEIDENISVFETTIRILGGLLSAHIIASDQKNLFSSSSSNHFEYDGKLLDLAEDLGDRLLPAFNTKTGIPYGTVNLLRGVPKGETKIASTAGGGSLLMEFGMLSRLTSRPEFFEAARKALLALYKARSVSTNLVGAHIDTEKRKWIETISTIGSNVDSYYETMIKSYVLFDDEELWDAFRTSYDAVRTHLAHGSFYADAQMSTGRHTKKVFNNLMAFWPGMQVMMGDFESASSTLNAFHAVRRVHEFTPEDFSFTKWKVLNARGTQRYPLRPELVESTWYMYEATGDRSWLIAGREMFESLSTLKVRCGVASVSSVVKREKKHELEDSMPSFFLAETMKYLILLFGGGRDFLRRIEDRYGGYVFTTEAHIFPISPSVVRLAHKSRWRQGDDTSSSSPSQWFSSSLLSTITSSSSILARNVSSMTCPASWTAFSYDTKFSEEEHVVKQKANQNTIVREGNIEISSSSRGGFMVKSKHVKVDISNLGFDPMTISSTISSSRPKDIYVFGYDQVSPVVMRCILSLDISSGTCPISTFQCPFDDTTASSPCRKCEFSPQSGWFTSDCDVNSYCISNEDDDACIHYGIYPVAVEEDDEEYGAYRFNCVPPAFGSLYQTLKEKTLNEQKQRRKLSSSSQPSSSFSETLVNVLKKAYMATKSSKEKVVTEIEENQEEHFIEDKIETLSWTLISGMEIEHYNPLDACEKSHLLYSGRHVASLVDRGTCTFVEKASNVQDSGAKLMIVGRTTVDSKPFVMSGGENANDLKERQLIPSIMVDKATMTRLRKLSTHFPSSRISVQIIEEPPYPYPRLRFPNDRSVSIYPGHEGETHWSIDIKYPDENDPTSVWQLFVREG